MKSIPLIALLLSILSLAAAAPAADAPRPNIVYFLADDMGWGDAGFHGSEIKTPAIDSIAARGARLEQFYVQPVCSPTRASFMTGRYPMRMGLQVSVIRPWAEYGMPLTEQTLPQGLKSVGYETAIVGKWHLGFVTPDYLPTHRGFDHQYGHYNGALDYFTHIRDGGFDWHKDDKVNHDEGYSTFLVRDEAIRLIKARDKDKPLFLYVPFNAVHAPHQVPPKYTEPYANLKEKRKTYAGMLAAMDESIGQILATLDSEGIRGNTLILFSSDNGGPAPGVVTSNGPLRAGKGTLYEGGVRVCAAAAWDGHIKPGSIVNQPIHVSDLYPTLLGLAGAKVDQKAALDGVDVWPTITDGKPSPRKEILHNTTPNNGAIRVGDFKLVIGGNIVDREEGPAADGPEVGEKAADPAPAARPNRNRVGKDPANVELFDLSKDPYEKKNLAAEMPEKVKELRTRYDELAKQAMPPKSAPKAKDFLTPKVWGEAK
jgi:arylsulfatase A-like enzyme